MKALIAEDEPLFRKLLTQLLSSQFELTVTEDGTSALASLQKENGPVLAILDWVMPGLSGLEVCRELRAHRQTAGIYVILLTARNSAAATAIAQAAALPAPAAISVCRGRQDTNVRTSRSTRNSGGQPNGCPPDFFCALTEAAGNEIRGALILRP